MPFQMSTIDRESKPTSMSINIKAGTTDPQLQTLVNAVDAVILGSDIKGTKSVLTVIDPGSAVPPANDFAQRGNKWLFRVQDAVNGNIFTHEIGTADNAILASSTDDFIDLTVGAGATLKSAFEVAYESPYGNAGILLSVQQVSRKS